MTTDHAAALREPKTHVLKTWPVAFAAVRAGLKPWEFRKDDRDYQVGDTLWLKEYLPDEGRKTGAVEARDVAWLLRGGQFGIPPGYVIMSLANPAVLDELDQVKEERDAARDLATNRYESIMGKLSARAEAAEREREVLRAALETAAWRFDYLANQFRRDSDQSLASLASTFDEASTDARTALSAVGSARHTTDEVG